MVKVCPVCGGGNPGCPVCNAPPKRVQPKTFSLLGALLGAPYFEVQGVDLSKWNGKVNFAVLKTKAQYGFLRYGYGNGWQDANLITYYNDAKANDFPIGGYWFSYIGQDWQMHSDGFSELLKKYPPTLDAVIDGETTTLDQAGSLDWLKNMDGRLRFTINKVPLVYTAPYFWNEKIARSTYWAGRELFDANWTSAPSPMIPQDWTQGWLHWQWSADNNGKAAEYGSTGGDPDMDLDRFNGSCAQFNARYGTHIVPLGTAPPQPPVGTVPLVVLIGALDVNIRSAPNPSDASNVMGVATHGTKWYPEAVEFDQYVKEWYRCGKKVYIKKELTRLP